MPRHGSPIARLARLGFTDPSRAADLLQDAVLAPILQGARDPLDEAIGEAADPDQALVVLVRFLDALASAGPGAGTAEVAALLADDTAQRRRFLALLGGSPALGAHLVRHPGSWCHAIRDERLDPAERAARLVAAVSARGRGERSADDALRVAYRDQLVGIAAADLAAPDPRETVGDTAAQLADLAAAALQAALDIARQEHPRHADRTRLAVIGMGKCGGRELNYVSDVDVIFVAEPADGVPEEESTTAATHLATALMRACSAATAEGALWPVDAALRPEGKQGPLVRSVSSHRRYYRRWAKTWEFQALLKARFVAGDADVGSAYLDAVAPMIWEAANRDNFVEDLQAMRRRVEENVPQSETDRQLKLGAGGLRDVEFAVQLLQLVHGRTDERVRSPNTLQALADLARHGYVARDDAKRFAAAYRLLRTLEHRVQLYRMRRTHLMPSGEPDLRRLGRAVGERADPGQAVLARWREEKRVVRQIHEDLFYRPLLTAVAQLRPDEVQLTPDAAKDRLSALGFRDPAGALRHLEALTTGTTRTAAIQRTLLPVMLEWFAAEADPDAGLLAFRRLSDSLGRTFWYLKMLRDEGRAAERLARVLARSRYAGDLLLQAPESVRMLAEEEGLRPRSRDDVHATMRSAIARREDTDARLTAARVVRRQELFRIALADLVGAIGDDEVMAALTDLTEALLEAALDIARMQVAWVRGEPVRAEIALVGMGRLGGGECGYASDADLLVVYRPTGGVEGEAGQVVAEVVQEFIRLLGSAGPDPQLPLDLDLRPEGKSGPLARTLDSYRAYYRRWSLTWEAQALLRARPVAGDAQLGADFVAMIDPIRWPDDGLDAGQVREIRRLKARMEGERLPRGADPRTHLKLGRGGLSDVEWTVQLLQMQHAHKVPDLRTPRTMTALAAARQAGLVDPQDAAELAEAWYLASAVRNAVTLWRIRGSDILPTDLRDAEGVARILGESAGAGGTLGERYGRVTRRARTVTERVFFGRLDAGGAGRRS